MVRCFLIVFISTFGAAIGSDKVNTSIILGIDEIISGKKQICGNDVYIDEGRMTSVIFKSTKYINIARCTNQISNETIKLTIQYGNKIKANFNGEDRHEGGWKCMFLRELTGYVIGSYSDNGKYYAASYCNVTVKIRHSVTLSVTNPETNTTVEAKTSDVVYYNYKAGEKVIILCKKDKETGDVLRSGSMMVKYCHNDGSCGDSPRIQKSAIHNDTTLYENRTNGELYCIYRSILNETFEARVVFRLVSKLPKISEAGIEFREPRSITDIVLDGYIGDTKKYVCTNTQESGTIHFEICKNNHCNSGQYGTGKIYQNITLNEENNGIVVKCIFDTYGVKVETKINVYVNKPPVLTINGAVLDLYNSTTPDTYVIKGNVDEYREIRCENQEKPNPILYWKDCKGSTQDCKTTKNSQAVPYIVLAHTLKLKDNNKFLYCVFKNSRGKEISTRTTFLVKPKPQPPNTTTIKPTLLKPTPKLPVTAQTASSINPSPMMPRPPTVEAADQPSVSSSHASHTSQPDSSLSLIQQLEILKDGSSVTVFKNGDILNFQCLDTYNRSTEIELTSLDDDIVYVPVSYKTINNPKKSGKLSLGQYKMNFTSRTVLVVCVSFDYNGYNRYPIAENKLTLNRTTEEADSKVTEIADSLKGFFNNNANLMWVLLGGGICIILIIIVCIVKALKKGKREEAMIQRVSVNYENFTNESQEPTPPFPRGPKLEQTYLAPVDLQESPYAISRPVDTDTYALPYTPSNVEELYSKPVPKNSRVNELYSKVLPKSLRNKNTSKYVNSGINDELTYAEISHQNTDALDKKYPKRMEKVAAEDNYATIVNSNPDYANLNKQNKTGGGKETPKDDHYTNVFANDPYVNAKREDYAEPSYCELSRNH